MDEHEDSDGVGYGKPPKGSRFVKGQSGNPKGRPKGSISLENILHRVNSKLMKVNQNGRPCRLPMLETVLLRLATMAAAGDLAAAREYLQAVKMFPDLAVALKVPPSISLHFVSAKKKDDDQ